MDIIVENIFWERANLHILVNKKVSSAFITSLNQRIPLTFNNKEIILPVYNTPEGKQLEDGEWKFEINEKVLKVSTNIINILDGLTRIFKYKLVYAYTAEVGISDNNELLMTTMFMVKNFKPKKENVFKEEDTTKRRLRQLVRHATYKMSNIAYKIFYIFNNKKKVLFLSENDDHLTINLEPLKNELEKNYDYKIKVLTRNSFKRSTPIIYRLKEIYNIATSRYIIIDNYCPIFTYLRLNKKVKLVQVWHAAIGFKSVGYARFGKTGSPHPYISGHRMNTHVFVDNDDLKEVYKEVFGVSESIIYGYGIPRLENFLEEKNINKVKEDIYKEYPNFKGKRIVLFAPTYRGKGQLDAYYDMDKINQDKINTYCEANNTVFVVKFHPFVNNKLEINSKYENNIIDLTSYPSINNLLYITDILITDYSSCAYEASLLDIPVVFYRYDKYDYEYNRGIHTVNKFNTKTMEVLNEQELIDALEEIKKYKRRKIEYKKRNSIKKIIKEIFR